MDVHVCYIKEQYRQDDEEFLDILNELRDGEVSERTVETLTARKEAKAPEEVTKLYTHNVDVDKINNKKLKELSGEEN